MKNRSTLLIVVAMLSVLLSSCQSHFIADKDVRESVHHSFEARKAYFTQGGVFDIFEQELSSQERGAMEFLYASMSSSDMADYTGEFFLDNVRVALRAREQMEWGERVPDDLFRHFVLPVRVNNERMDEFRMKY